MVVGFDRNINYYKIQYAQLCINENPGCEFIATNTDAVTHLTDAQVSYMLFSIRLYWEVGILTSFVRTALDLFLFLVGREHVTSIAARTSTEQCLLFFCSRARGLIPKNTLDLCAAVTKGLGFSDQSRDQEDRCCTIANDPWRVRVARHVVI